MKKGDKIYGVYSLTSSHVPTCLYRNRDSAIKALDNDYTELIELTVSDIHTAELHLKEKLSTCVL